MRCQGYVQNKCREEPTKRASSIMPAHTKPEDAYFIEDGVCYGYTYWFCERCLVKALGHDKRLHVWED